MMPHEEIEALEATIRRWESSVLHGQEMLRSLEAAAGSMGEATLQHPGHVGQGDVAGEEEGAGQEEGAQEASATETETELRACAGVVKQ